MSAEFLIQKMMILLGNWMKNTKPCPAILSILLEVFCCFFLIQKILGFVRELDEEDQTTPSHNIKHLA